MTKRRAATAVWCAMAVIGITVGATAHRAAGQAEVAAARGAGGGKNEGSAKNVVALDVVLDDVDVNEGTISATVAGKKVDTMLKEKLLEQVQGKQPAGQRKRGPARLVDLPVAKEAEIHISSRWPSFANHLPRGLADLKEMVGGPVSLRFIVEENRMIVTGICAWRGPPVDRPD